MAGQSLRGYGASNKDGDNKLLIFLLLKTNYTYMYSKELLILIFFMGFFGCFSNIQAQQPKVQEAPEENLVDFPQGNTKQEVIENIERKDSLDWHDFIQLAVTYSSYEDETAKIESLIESALEANLDHACENLEFIINNQKEWDLTKKHSRLVRSKLKQYGCE